MKLIIFTDLDATLLDPVTYSWEAASEALEALKARHTSIVLVSSKTLAEMAPLHSELCLEDPLVIENGGGIALKPESALAGEFLGRRRFSVAGKHGVYLLIALGIEYHSLVAAIGEISSELGIPLAGFSSMSAETIAGLSGLSLEQAENAKQRMFDEPFLLPLQARGREGDLLDAAARRNLTAVEGGRFWHLMGHTGKGTGVSFLIEAYRKIYGQIHTVGLGDSPNDLPFLELVDTAIVLGKVAASSLFCDKLKNVRTASIPGPRGWNEEVLFLLDELEFN